jgi:hypothetical protein
MKEHTHKRRRIDHTAPTDTNAAQETNKDDARLQTEPANQMEARKSPVLVSLFARRKKQRAPQATPSGPVLYELYLDDKTRGKTKVLEEVGQMTTFDMEGWMYSYIMVAINQDSVMISDRQKLYVYNANSWECVLAKSPEYTGVSWKFIDAVLLPCGDLVAACSVLGSSTDTQPQTPGPFTAIMVLDPATLHTKCTFEEDSNFRRMRMFRFEQHEGFMLFHDRFIVVYERDPSDASGYSKRSFELESDYVIHDCLFIDDKHIAVSHGSLATMVEIETSKYIGTFRPSGEFQRNSQFDRRDWDECECRLRCLSNGHTLIWSAAYFSVWTGTTCLYTRELHGGIYTVKEMPDNKLFACSHTKCMVVDISTQTVVDKFKTPAQHPDIYRCQSIVLNRVH